MVDEGDAVAAAPHVPGYELGALLARGGTSEVWAGVALDGGRRVAVKVVHAELGSLEAAAREATLSARAASAHVVAVEACLQLADGRVAVVMPHLLGGAVDALVRARGHLSPGEVVTVLAPVASALGRLHGLGVVHGDVSPGNVLLDLDGRPVLGDLGLGHVVGEVSPGVWGTDGYVAPEVLLGADPSPASDVYALGAVGWLCLTGTVPGPPGLRPELAEVCRAGAGSEAVVSALAAAVGAEPADRPSADELAWLLFGAAEPEPLRLVHGDDEVSAVTYRLRAAAGRPPAAPAAAGRRRPTWPPMPWPPARRVRWPSRRMPSRSSRIPSPSPSVPSTPGPMPWRPGVGRLGPDGGQGRLGHQGRHAAAEVRRGWRPRRSSGRSRRAALVSLLLLGLTTLAGLTVAATGRDGGGARAGSALDGPAASGRPTDVRPDAPTAARPDPRTGTGPDVKSDPRTDVEAPRTRPADLLGVLAEGRAAAWREATPALLHAVDAPGSVAAVRDAAAVAEVSRAGLRYTGLRYAVAQVAVVSASHRHAVLRARFDAGPYAVTGAWGSTSRPAVPGEAVLVDLVFTDAGWRVGDVRPAS